MALSTLSKRQWEKEGLTTTKNNQKPELLLGIATPYLKAKVSEVSLG